MSRSLELSRSVSNYLSQSKGFGLYIAQGTMESIMTTTISTSAAALLNRIHQLDQYIQSVRHLDDGAAEFFLVDQIRAQLTRDCRDYIMACADAEVAPEPTLWPHVRWLLLMPTLPAVASDFRSQVY